MSRIEYPPHTAEFAAPTPRYRSRRAAVQIAIGYNDMVFPTSKLFANGLRIVELLHGDCAVRRWACLVSIVSWSAMLGCSRNPSPGGVILNYDEDRQRFVTQDCWINAVAFSTPDGKYLASAGSDDTVVLWSTKTGRVISTIGDGSGGARAVAFSSDGNLLATGHGDGQIRLYDVSDPTSPKLKEGKLDHKGEISCLTFAQQPNGMLVLASGGVVRAEHGDPNSDRGLGIVRIWHVDVKKGEYRELWSYPHKGQVTCVAISSDGEYIASGGFDKSIKVGSMRARQLKYGDLSAHSHWVRAVVFSPDDNSLISAGSDNSIKHWDLNTGRITAVDDRLGNGPIRAMATWRGGQRLLVGCVGGDIVVQNKESGGSSELSGHTYVVRCLAVNPVWHARMLASGGADRTVRLWQVQ